MSLMSTNSADVLNKIEAVAGVVDALLDDQNQGDVLGDDLVRLVGPVVGSGKVTYGAVLRLALLNDSLRIAESAIQSDGIVSDAEVAYVTPLVQSAARYLSELRAAYRDFGQLGSTQVQHFLQVHARDRQLFGGACAKTEWRGFEICRAAAEAGADRGALSEYQRLVLRVVGDIFEMSTGSPAQQAARSELETLIRLKSKLSNEEPNSQLADARVRAFCSVTGPEVFHATAHAHQIWMRDPLDVPVVHAEARAAYESMLNRLSSASLPDLGRILLVRGEAGAGKTHLLRAFRRSLHEQRLGYTGYLQLSAMAASYSRYVLVKLIEGLERPYDPPEIEESGLMVLSDAIAIAGLPGERLTALRESELNHEELARLTGALADQLLNSGAFDGIDVDLLRAMLYLQRRDVPVQARVLKYLRCEPLNAYDQELVGGLAVQVGEDAALRMIEMLGKLIWSSGGGALVLLVDQLEDVFHLPDAPERYQRLMDTLRYVSDHVPTSVVVIACLSDAYEQLRKRLTQSVLDRIERDPAPVQLAATRTLAEIEQIVQLRLSYLYEQQEVRFREDEAIFPFTRKSLSKLANMRTRDILDWCREYQQACIFAGQLVEPSEQVSRLALERRGASSAPSAPSTEPNLDQLWDGFCSDCTEATPDDEAELSSLLAWAIQEALSEVDGISAKVAAEGRFVKVSLPEAAPTDGVLIGLCNRDARGGGLAQEVEETCEQAKASAFRPVLARCSAFPDNPRTKIVSLLGQVIKGGGRKVVVEDAEWRTMLALRTFGKHHAGKAGFAEWLRRSRPLAQLSALRQLLDLDALENAAMAAELSRNKASAREAEVKATPRPGQVPDVNSDQRSTLSGQQAVSRPSVTKGEPTAVGKTAVSSNSVALTSNPLVLGRQRSLVNAGPVVLEAEALSRHAAFLGSTGSGKTTLALNVIEQAALRGVPVLLVDRKGDLCTYGQKEFWVNGEADARASERKRQLYERLDVRVFTPGDPSGCAVRIPVVPTGLGALPSYERSKLARQAASALGAMMGYRETQADQARLGIVAKAIELLSQVGESEELTLPQLTELIATQDPALLEQLGRLDNKHFRRLVDHLETLRLQRGDLLTEGAELLAAQTFLAPSEATGKVRFSIVSTKFLGDTQAVDFWVSRLLLELGRWASAHPSKSLQALVMLDEADIYLPANRKPATKEPMMDLLKRARSAGIGILLATQSPGDLDYKCRDNIQTWFVGRIAETTAVSKMKPLLSEAKTNIERSLASAKVGEFFLLSSGNVTELYAEQSVMKTEQLPEHQILEIARERAAQ